MSKGITVSIIMASVLLSGCALSDLFNKRDNSQNPGTASDYYTGGPNDMRDHPRYYPPRPVTSYSQQEPTSSAPRMQPTADDLKTSNAIRSNFSTDPQLQPYTIHVYTLNGRTELSGYLPDTLRDHAVQIAQQTQGVQSVDTHSLGTSQK